MTEQITDQGSVAPRMARVPSSAGPASAAGGDCWVLVTGSSSGIGRAIALRLAADGYHVVVHCRASVRAAQQVAEAVGALGRQARLLQFDVTDRQAAADALLADVAQHGAYYGVVCNAGIAADNAFAAMPGEDWDRVLQTSLGGFYNVLHPLTMPMVRRRAPGRIVTLASVSGIVGNRGQANYSAAKAGVVGATKALAVELAGRAITVNCVAPGLIDTDMVSPEVAQRALQAVPMGRMGRPEEVAAVVAFLMRPDAGYLTRQVISVNGGMV